MNDLLIMMAEILPVDLILEQMEESLKEYKLTKSEDSKKALIIACMIFANKHVIEKVGSADKLMKDLDEIRDAVKFVDGLKPKS